MVDTWVRLIEGDVKDFEDCPDAIKEEVKVRLMEDGYWDED